MKDNRFANFSLWYDNFMRYYNKNSACYSVHYHVPAVQLSSDSQQKIVFKNDYYHNIQGRIQDLIKGGAPDRYRPKLPTVRSSIGRAKRALFSMGSGACLRALEALGYFITKYAFSPFWGTFLYYF